MPTIENFHRKLYTIRGQPYRLDILDTSGHHPFPAMTKLSYITGTSNKHVSIVLPSTKTSSFVESL